MVLFRELAVIVLPQKEEKSSANSVLEPIYKQVSLIYLTSFVTVSGSSVSGVSTLSEITFEVLLSSEISSSKSRYSISLPVQVSFARLRRLSCFSMINAVSSAPPIPVVPRILFSGSLSPCLRLWWTSRIVIFSLSAISLMRSTSL